MRKFARYGTAIASCYDLFFPPDRSDEADLWARIAGKKASHLLDLMVGTGEVALLLAQRGHHVMGVDNSSAMLSLAEERRRATKPAVAARVTFRRGDIRTAALPKGRFDLAYVGNGSWHLLTAESSRVAALRRVRMSLKRRGKLALDLFPPLRKSSCSGPRTFEPLRPPPTGAAVAKTSVSEADHTRQCLSIRQVLTVDGQRTRHHLVLQILVPDRIRGELARAGFTDVRLYGGDRLQPFTVSSKKLLVIASP